jgi:hypothetical protein
MSMDALKLQTASILFVTFGWMTSFCDGAETYQTVNFSVKAASAATAEEVGKAAEGYRRQLAIFWLGKPLPNWSAPCKIVVKEGQIGAGGRTTFQFARGEVLNWSMEVQGTKERILDSVLPHEVNHTIFACHFRRPLPRWADEGAATLFEHRSEQLKQLGLLNQVIRGRSSMITLRELLSMKKYPDDYHRMLTLYAQGYALADFLVQQKGRHAYLKFIADGEKIGWDEAIKTNFDHDGIESLEKNWKGWILAGMPKLTLPREQMLAATASAESEAAARPELPVASPNRSAPKPRRSAVVRSQSPESSSAKTVEADKNPPTSDEAMPARFLEARPTNSGSVMPTRIEAPLPKRKPSGSMAEDSQAAVKRNFAGDVAESVDSEGNEPVPPFRRNKSSHEEARTAPHAELFGAPKNSEDLQPTSVLEEDKAPRRAPEFKFGEPRKKNPPSATGSKPDWAGFPGAKF